VIKNSFLKAQAGKSLAQKRTTPFLRRLVASIVDRAARERYGDAYAMKCLQTSQAVLTLLDRVGIGGILCEGALCAALLYEDSRADGWGGFWGANHHVWAMTPFGEIVDLSVSAMHNHPRSGRKDGIASPAIWWDDKRSAPPVSRYLPDNFFRSIAFNDAAGAPDLAAFQTLVVEIFEATLLSGDIGQVGFEALLENMHSAEALRRQGHPWLARALAFQAMNPPLPTWISRREADIAAAARAGAAPASVLRPSPPGPQNA
jgi:hypothetical protein